MGSKVNEYVLCLKRIREWKELNRSRTPATDLQRPRKLSSCLHTSVWGETQLRGSLIQIHCLFHLGSNQILLKEFGFSCLSHWRLLAASYPEFPQTAVGWRRVIQARFAIRPLTPSAAHPARTAHARCPRAWKAQGKCAQRFHLIIVISEFDLRYCR